MSLLSIIHAGTIDNINGVATFEGLEDVFESTLTVILEVAGAALFVMLIVGGFKYVTSGGNPKQTEAAKQTITYAILGIVLVASAFFIIQVIETFTGASLSEFNIGS